MWNATFDAATERSCLHRTRRLGREATAVQQGQTERERGRKGGESPFFFAVEDISYRTGIKLPRALATVYSVTVPLFSCDSYSLALSAAKCVDMSSNMWPPTFAFWEISHKSSKCGECVDYCRHRTTVSRLPFCCLLPISGCPRYLDQPYDVPRPPFGFDLSSIGCPRRRRRGWR